MKNKIKFNKRFRDIFLILTEFCPNRCEYCYIEHRDKRETMSMEMIDKLIESFGYETPRIVFFGGEPLVEYELMKQIIEKYKHRCTFQIVTSATVNYDSFLKEIAGQHKIDELQLSWDGNGVNRPDSHGSYHVDEVMKKILATLEAGQQTDIKCVLAEGNIEYFVSNFIMFKTLRETYPGLVHGDFCIAHQPSMDQCFHKSFRSGLRECLDIITKDLSLSSDIYIPRDWLNKIISVVTKDENYSSCDAGNYIVMRPNGDLYPCTIFSQIHLDELEKNPFYLGNINDKELKDDVFNSIKTKCSKSECIDCNLKHLCDGGCRYERFSNYKEEWECNSCEHQCKNIKIYAEEIETFIQSLSVTQRDNLRKLLLRYQNWVIGYARPIKL